MLIQTGPGLDRTSLQIPGMKEFFSNWWGLADVFSGRRGIVKRWTIMNRSGFTQFIQVRSAGTILTGWWFHIFGLFSIVYGIILPID
jgi:hypothetical protein